MILGYSHPSSVMYSCNGYSNHSHKASNRFCLLFVDFFLVFTFFLLPGLMIFTFKAYLGFRQRLPRHTGHSTSPKMIRPKNDGCNHSTSTVGITMPEKNGVSMVFPWWFNVCLMEFHGIFWV